MQRYFYFLCFPFARERHSNCRLTCICGFADAQSGGKVGAKVAVPYRHSKQLSCQNKCQVEAHVRRFIKH